MKPKQFVFTWDGDPDTTPTKPLQIHTQYNGWGHSEEEYGEQVAIKLESHFLRGAVFYYRGIEE